MKEDEPTTLQDPRIVSSRQIYAIVNDVFKTIIEFSSRVSNLTSADERRLENLVYYILGSLLMG